MKRLERFLPAVRAELNMDPRKVVVRALSSGLPQHGFNRFRTHLLIGAGVRIGHGAAIGGPLRITGPGLVGKLLSIGPGSYLSGNLHIDLGADVRIGARVYIGDDVKLLTGTHELGGSEQRCDRLRWASIEIGDGSWIGTAVTIMPGVKIGPGAVVGAGSIVIADVAADCVFAGVPARFIRGLDERKVVADAPQSGTWAAARPRVRLSENADDHPTRENNEHEVRAATGAAWRPGR